MNKKQKDDRILEASKRARIYHLVNTERALEKTKEKINLTESVERQIILWPKVMKIAASIAIIFAVGWLAFQNQFADQWIMYSSGSEIKEYKLPDGTLITLNENSTLRINQNMTSARKVKLEGEAFFDVKRDETRPFIISSGGAQVEVLGTSFNIQSNQAHVEVSVTSGEVEVREQDQKSNSTILVKGEAALFDRQSNTIEKNVANVNYLAWKTGVYTFNQAPVRDAIKLLSQQHNIKIQFNGNTAKNCQITSVFDNQTWEEITQEFILIHSLEFQKIKDGLIEVKGGNCEQ